MTFQIEKNRPPSEVCEGVTYAHVYWTVGPSPKDSARSEVDDPPNGGWGMCFVLDETPKTVRLFSLWHVKSWVVSKQSSEFLSLYGPLEGFTDRARSNFKDRFPIYYAAHKLRGWASDFATAERLMKLFGVTIPTEDTWLQLAPSAAKHADNAHDYAVHPDGATGFRPSSSPARPKSSGGKAPDTKIIGVKKPVKREGRKGEILEFLLAGNSSVLAATDKFGISRSNFLSQLFLLRKDHNIGYVVNADEVAIQLPEGCLDPFEELKGDET
jgi:hypothetical protein